MGIDVNKVSISKPDADGVVKITIPDAEMLDVDLDEESMSEPLTDAFYDYLDELTILYKGVKYNKQSIEDAV